MLFSIFRIPKISSRRLKVKSYTKNQVPKVWPMLGQWKSVKIFYLRLFWSDFRIPRLEKRLYTRFQQNLATMGGAIWFESWWCQKKEKLTIKISYFQIAKLFKIFLATIFLMLFSDSSHRELLIYRFSALWKCMILPPVEVSGVKLVKFSRVSNKKRLWEG